MNNNDNLNNIINTDNHFINTSNNEENTTQHSSMLGSVPDYTSNDISVPNNNGSMGASLDTNNLNNNTQVNDANNFILSSQSMEEMSNNVQPMNESLSFDKKAFIILVILLLAVIYFMPYISDFIENMNW